MGVYVYQVKSHCVEQASVSEVVKPREGDCEEGRLLAECVLA